MLKQKADEVYTNGRYVFKRIFHDESFANVITGRWPERMQPVVVALASNERYFPGLYCAVASALRHVAAGTRVDVRVLDGGISKSSRNTLSRLAESFGQSVRL